MTKKTEALKWFNGILPEYMKTEHLETIRAALTQEQLKTTQNCSYEPKVDVDDVLLKIINENRKDFKLPSLDKIEHATPREVLSGARSALHDLAAEGYLAPQWQPIETAPIGVEVLLFCPDRGCQSNKERIELGYADNGNGSHHSWATHWMPLPAAPKKEG